MNCLKKKDLIKNIVQYYEQPKIIKFLEDSLQIYKSGGMLCKNVETKRRFGGIFIKLIKDSIKYYSQKYFF